MAPASTERITLEVALRDLASRPFQQVAQQADQSLRRIQESTQRANEATARWRQSVEQSNTGFGRLERDASRSLGAIQRAAGNAAGPTGAGSLHEQIIRNQRAFGEQATAAQKATQRVSEAFNQQATQAAQANSRLGETLRNAGRDAEASAASSGESLGSTLGRSVLKGIGLVMAVGGGIAGALFGKETLQKGYERTTTIENAKTSLNTILGDSAQVDELMAGILAKVKGTPWNLDQFADAGKNMVALGVDAQKVPGYLEAIGNAAAATGKGAAGLDLVTDAFGKIATKGRVQLIDVWSISRSGVNALAILANEWGVTTDAMQDMISEGAVPAERALDALAAGIMNGSDGVAGATASLGGAMNALGKTLTGSVGSRGAAQARLGEAILRPHIAGMTSFNNAVADMFDSIAPGAERASGMFSGIWDKLNAGIASVPAMITKAKEAWKVLKTGDFAGESAGIGEEDSPLVRALLFAHRTFETVSSGLNQAWQILFKGDFVGGALEEDSPLVNLLFRLRDGGIETFDRLSAVWDRIMAAGKDAWPAVKQIGESLLTAAAAFADSGMSVGAAIWQIFLATAELLAATIENVLVPALQWVADFMTENTGVVQVLVGTWLTYRGIILATTLLARGYALVLGIMTAAQWALNFAMRANPLMLLVTAIGALVAAVVWAYNNVEWFRDLVDNAWDVISNAAKWAWDNVLKPVFDWIGEAAVKVADWFVWLWQDQVIPAWEALQPTIQRVWEFLKSTFDNIMNFLGGWWDIISGIFTGDWDKVWSGVQRVFTAVWDQIKNYASTVWDLLVDWFGDIVSAIWDGLKSAASAVWTWFTGLPGRIWDAIKQAHSWFVERGTEFVWWLVAGIRDGAVALWEFALALPGRVWDGIFAAKDWVIEKGGEFLGWLWDGIKNTAVAVWNWFLNLPSNLWSFISSTWATVWDWGSQLVSDIWEGVKAKAVDVWDWFLNLPSSIWDFVSSTWATVKDWGIDLIQKIWDGLTEKVSDLWNWFIALPGVLWEQAKGAWESFKDWGRGIVEGIVAGIKSMPDAIWEAVKSVAIGSATSIVPFAGGVVGEIIDGNTSNAPGGISTPNSDGTRRGIGGTFADGGMLYGPGGPRDDLIPLWGSNGEFMVNAASTAKHRGLLEMINADRYADGGPIERGRAMGRGMWTAGGALKDLIVAKVKEMFSWGFGGGDSGGYTGDVPQGEAVERWRPLAMQALQAVGNWKGQNLTPFIGNMLLQIRTESGGNPNAINNWDSNAQRGTPSKGLLQTIDPTFQNALAGTPFAGLIGRGPYDPWANMIASIIYGLNRYGSLANAYRGVAYDQGGMWPSGTPGWNLTGRPEAVLDPDESAGLKAYAASGGFDHKGKGGNGGIVIESGAFPIVIQGNATERTAHEIREELEDMLRDILREDLARSY